LLFYYKNDVFPASVFKVTTLIFWGSRDVIGHVTIRLDIMWSPIRGPL